MAGTVVVVRRRKTVPALPPLRTMESAIFFFSPSNAVKRRFCYTGSALDREKERGASECLQECLLLSRRAFCLGVSQKGKVHHVGTLIKQCHVILFQNKNILANSFSIGGGIKSIQFDHLLTIGAAATRKGYKISSLANLIFRLLPSEKTSENKRAQTSYI